MNEETTGETNALQGDVAADYSRRSTGGKRLNRLPLYIGGAVVGGILLLMTVALVIRSSIGGADQSTEQESRQSAGDDASELTSGQTDGIISEEPASSPPAQTETAQSPYSETVTVEPTDDREERMAARIAEYEDERMMQEMQLRDRLASDALNANMRLALPGLEVEGERTNSTASVNSAQALASANVAFPGLAAPLPSAPGAGQPLTATDALSAIKGGGTTGTADPNNQSAKAAFLENAGQLDTSDYLARSVQKPLSPYELKQGSVIPGVLVTGINSDLPGRIIGQVSRNVYDSTTGRHLLIPQGTKIFGRYDSDVSFGQQRVLAAWTRLIFPNGSSINIEGMAGTDQAGAGGFSDRVNNHWGKTLQSALLISVIGAGVQNLTDSGDSDDVADAIRESFGDTFSSVAQKSVERSLSVQPTLEIRPGYRFLIVVDKDMVLKPYG